MSQAHPIFSGGASTLSRLWPCLALALLVQLPAFAQETEAEEADAQDENAAIENVTGVECRQRGGQIVCAEELIVTGSRIRRSTYTSIAPLQIISAGVKREAGLIDASEILQEATTASGVQFDLSFEGFVLEDGPGTTTINLRGLGANRTLVLLNGRRLAPTGVEGVPSSPNLSIVPGLLVQQYDQLLDGASSIYGSDAVSGVTNAILRKDFNGLTIELAPRYPHHNGGTRQVHGLSWGRNWDRGFIGMGAQYDDREAVTLADRPWTAGCERHIEIDRGGNIRNQELWHSTQYGMEWDDCTFGDLTGAVIVPGSSPGRTEWLFNTPGYTNGNWPNFSASGWSAIWNAGRYGVDGDQDGKPDINFRDYSTNGRQQHRHLIAPFSSATGMAYGEYTFEGEANLTPYFEVLYGASDYEANSGAQLRFFPWVPATNPYNICNPEAEGGIDCGLALDALYANPGYIAGWNELYSEFCVAQGIPATACGPLAFDISAGAIGAQRTQPVIHVRGDRNFVETETTWYRGVAGLRGDLPFLNVGTLADWTFDVSVTRSHSSAEASRYGIRRDRFDLAMGYYSNDWTPCENNISETERAARRNSRSVPLRPLSAPDAVPGCVPINMFAPSLYAIVDGDFGTAAERDYLFGSRNFETKYTQTLLTLYLTGDLFELKAGNVAGGIGFEYRTDEIESLPDQVAGEGLLWGFFADGGAIGEKYTRELFGEIEMPLLAGKRGARELTVNFSTRYTDDEFYGGAWTGAARIGWRPVDSFLVRATWGTSYRAPNLRELFLQSQTSFPTVTDPCYAPFASYEDNIEEGGERRYNPELDTRDPFVLQRCREEGVDPTLAGKNTANFYGVESASGGSLELDEETSESMSVGFAWEQPFTQAFGMTLGLTYYDIDIEGTIIEPSSGYIVFDCYENENSAGQFCDRITRDFSNVEEPAMQFINRSFINRDEESVRGVDINLTLDTTLTIFERALDLSVDVVGHRLIERNTLFVNDEGDRDFNKDAHEWFFAEHKAEAALRLDYDRWRLSWQSRYLGDYDNYRDGDEEWGDINSSSGVYSHTCLGPPTDVQCKDVETASDYWVHHVSITYRGDDWVIVAGSRNVFDEPPPQVNPGDVWSQTNNTPRGLGYDLMGRSYFVTGTFTFGGER